MPSELPPAILPVATTVCLAEAAPAEPAAGEGPPLPFQLLPLVAIAVAAYLLLFRPERERVRRQQAMRDSVKKNDRVVTSSGIYGTVTAVDRDADRVSLRVDDAANVKIAVTLASIARIFPTEKSGSSESASS